MTINEARLHANIAARAERITEDYRLVWNRHEGRFEVRRKDDRNRSYVVTAAACSCPSFANHDTCKHAQGLAELTKVEIARYTLLGFAEDRTRFESFLAEHEAAPYADWLAQMEDAEDAVHGCDPYARY